MTEEEKLTVEESHKKFAVDFFNQIWPLLGKENRTPEEDEQMINAAHASLFHWRQIGKPIHSQRGEQMVSHVYAVLGMGESALFHAKKCYELTEENKFGDFDLGYSLAAMARANAAVGNKSEFEKYFKLAKEAGEKIEKKENKELFLSDLEAGPWYNMR
jgi:hypothetical protein